MKNKRITNEVPLEKIIKGFANKNRLQIISLLDREPEMNVADIAERLKIEFKNTSAHINKLSVAGIVIKKYRGHNVLHSLTTRGKLILKFVRIIE